MYLDGGGVPADKLEAEKWFRHAASRNDPWAAAQLGAMALLGQDNLKPGPESTAWLRTAAEAGDAVSMLNLGMVYAHGKGADVDYIEAYKWFTLAAQRGVINGRKGIRSKMTKAQVAEAEKRAAKWKKT